MELKDYLKTLKTNEELKAYAERSNTSAGYLKSHVIPVNRIAKKPLIQSLAKGSQGNVHVVEVLNHFYSDILDGNLKLVANG